LRAIGVVISRAIGVVISRARRSSSYLRRRLVKRPAYIALLAIFACIFTIAFPKNSSAIGECGLACCIAGATGSGATLARNFGLSLSHEYTHMETIRHNSSEVELKEAIDENMGTSMSYSIPTEMIMQKYTLVGVLPVTERLSFLAAVPYVVNDMDMLMAMDMGMMGTVYSDMKMDTVDGFGDASVMALYTLYTDAPVKPTQRLTLGAGVKAPTGSSDEKTASGRMVHAMMQPGSGSWDALFLVNYMKAFYPLVLQANLFYQLTTEGREGYEFGDQFSADVSAAYQALGFLNVGVAINALHTGKDDDSDDQYSRPLTSMVDNTVNTGLTSVLVSPFVQVKAPGTPLSAEVKFQTPLYQDVNGYQQVLDWRVISSLTFAF
jgi:hypothetical protein